jgi:putative ATP-dependent endonuclease of OLD family
MRIAQLTVQNFKALRDVSLPMSRFVCIIGQNNSGKSSLLQSLLLFVEGRKLNASYFYDESKDITISVRFEEVTESDLELLAEEHRPRFEPLLVNNSVTLVRRYDPDGTHRLKCVTLVPSDPRFSAEQIDSLTKGKKPGNDFADEIIQAFPELEGAVDAKTNQTRVKELVAELASHVPDEAKEEREMDLPTGIDNSIRSFLPEPIYIPAVKDLGDEIKTKDSTSFGKLLGILLTAISSELGEAEEEFRDLKKKLNVIEQGDGTSVDNRLDAVKTVESTVERFVQEHFGSVGISIHIPPPDIKTVLSNAEVWADDGVKGLIETKGDGLKRAVTFSILRSYVELKRRAQLAESAAPSSGYLFLFEEPELYLHPTAQRFLFDALSEIGQTNHVVLSTHSPLFFSADQTGTFVKLTKRQDPGSQGKPFGHALPVDLTSVDNKTRFQLISYETNNTAFFADTVVLVEGDTDYLVFPHLAHLLKPSWSFERSGIALCRVQGKGSFGRYREFFGAFEVRTIVLADLDCIVDGFEHLGAIESCVTQRAELLAEVDRVIANKAVEPQLSSDHLKKTAESPTRRGRWEALCEAHERCERGDASSKDLRAAGESFFAPETALSRRSVLEDSSNTDALRLKRELLALLRGCDVYLLERGKIEAYFPAGIQGPDKPSRALDFIQKIDTRELAVALCDQIPVGDSGQAVPEFEMIFSGIFENKNVAEE